MGAPRSVRTASPAAQGSAERDPSVAALLRRAGLHARKGLSQHFLTDPGVCLAMAEAAELGEQDEVLEIGPGLGILTRVLVERAARVVAVELDTRLAALLPEQLPTPKLQIVTGDALQLDPAEHFSGPYKLVANLPYQISSAVLTRYLIEVRRPSHLVLMLQREVAERVAAPPGEASYLSNLARAVAEPRIVRRVPAGAFYPRPKVESAVLELRPRPAPVVPPEQLGALLRLIRLGFTQPRKTLANSLAQGLGTPRGEVAARLAAAGQDPGARPQQLDLTAWVRLLAGGLIEG